MEVKTIKKYEYRFEEFEFINKLGLDGYSVEYASSSGGIISIRTSSKLPTN